MSLTACGRVEHVRVGQILPPREGAIHLRLFFADELLRRFHGGTQWRIQKTRQRQPFRRPVHRRSMQHTLVPRIAQHLQIE